MSEGRTVYERRLEIVLQMFSILDIHADTKDTLWGSRIPRDVFLDHAVNNRLMDFRDKLREVFSAQRMPSLHSTFESKSKQPGLNLFRQSCRRVGIDLKPVAVSAG